MENTENQEFTKNSQGKGPDRADEEQIGEEAQVDEEKENGKEDKVECETSEVKEKQEEEDFKSKYYYLAAEMENMKKRAQKERENLLKFGNEKILSDLIDVADNFERIMDVLQKEKQKEEAKNVHTIVTGIEMVHKQFLEVLARYGLVAVDSLGKMFDPNFHEAVSEKAYEGKKHHEIVEEYQKGYTLNGRLLRPAKVVVAKSE